MQQGKDNPSMYLELQPMWIERKWESMRWMWLLHLSEAVEHIFEQPCTRKCWKSGFWTLNICPRVKVKGAALTLPFVILGSQPTMHEKYINHWQSHNTRRKWPYAKLYTLAALSGLCAFCVRNLSGKKDCLTFSLENLSHTTPIAASLSLPCLSSGIEAVSFSAKKVCLKPLLP